jgi:vacuolar iron transporter family protein
MTKPDLSHTKNEEHVAEHVFEEKNRIGNLSQIRELIFGAQDGLLVPLGVVSSVAGAFFNNHIVIVAGIAEALAGAFSMGTGAYLASQAEAQVHQSEIKKEAEAIKKWRDVEKEEMIILFEQEGVPRKNAEIIVENMNEKSFFNTMVQKELGLDPDPFGTPMRDAGFVGLSYLVNAAIPLLPYFFFPVRQALYISIGLTLAALFALGTLKAKFAALSYFKSGLQVMAVGAFSGLGGYLLGTFLPKLLHIQ